MKKFIALIFTIAALVLVFSRVPMDALLRALLRVNLTWFLAAGGLFGVSLVLAAWRWHLLLRLNQASVSFSTTLRILLVSHLGNVALLGSAGGDVARTVLYNRWFGIPISRVINSTLHDRLFISAGFFTFLIATILVGKPLPASATLSITFSSILKKWPILVGAGIVIFTLAAWKRSIFRSAIDSLLGGFRQILSNFKKSCLIFLLSIFIQGLYSLSFALTLRSFTGHFAWLDFFWFFPLILFAAALPISIGGLGVREGASVYLFGLGEVAEPEALATSMAFFGLACFWSIFGAVFLYQFQKATLREVAEKITCIITGDVEEPQLHRLMNFLNPVKEIDQILLLRRSDKTFKPNPGHQHLEIVDLTAVEAEAWWPGVLQIVRNPILLFLNPESELAASAGASIVQTLRDPTIVGGTVHQRSRPSQHPPNIAAFFGGFRTPLPGNPLSEDNFFARSSVLREFRLVPSLEGRGEFFKKLRRSGRVVRTSADLGN